MGKRFAAVLLGLVLAGCSTTKVGLKYDARHASPAAAGAQPVKVGSFVDERGEPADWIGAIRGGFGNPLKKIEAERPVAELVRDAFAAGLRARGLEEAPSARYQLSGVIRKLDCNQMARREANVEIEVSVIDSATGQASFTRSYSASNVDGSLMSLKTGVFASVEDLRSLTEKTLQETVDKALDDTALRSALHM